MRTSNAPRRCTTSAPGRGLALFALTFALGPGCRAPAAQEPPPAPEKTDATLTVQKFQELITQCALKPVHAMEDDPYDKTKPDMDEDVFAKAVERLEEGKAAPAEPPKPAVNSTEFPENPYLVFGKRIQVYPETGLIMKPYPLRVGTGKKLNDLLTTYGNFPLYDAKTGPQKPDTVRLELQEKWDMEPFVADLRVPVPFFDDAKPDKSINLADWLIVTAGFER